MNIEEIKTAKDIDLIIPEDIIGAPYAFQRVGASFLVANKRALLGDSMGLGKSFQVILAMSVLKRINQLPPRVLIVTVNSAIYQWQKEFQKFSKEYKVIIVTAGMSPTERAEFYNELPGECVVITNYSLMRIDNEFLLKLGFKLIAWDEAALFKNYKSKTFKAAQDLSMAAERSWALSAYAMPNNPFELFGVYSVTVPDLFARYYGTRRFDGITKFRELYTLEEPIIGRGGVPKMTEQGYIIKQTVGYKNLDRLKQRISPFYIGRTYADVAAQVPNLIIKESNLEMTNDQRTIYYQTEHGLNGKTPMDMILAKFVALQQISNGVDFYKHTKGTDISPKIEEIKRFLSEELEEEKIVIFSKFRQFIDILEDELKEYSPVRITGDENIDERERNKEKFTNDPNCRVLLMTQAGGFALNLQVARVMMFVDLPFSFGMMEQIIGRIRRIGSEHEVVVAVFLMMNDSLDRHVLDVLRSKKMIIEQVMGGRDVLDNIAQNDIKEILKRRMEEKGQDVY